MIFNSEFNSKNLSRIFCLQLCLMKNEEFYPEMDLRTICKSIRIKTLYFVSMSSRLFLFTLMIICIRRMLACPMTRCVRDMIPMSKPKNFIVALFLSCSVIGAFCNHVNIFSRILRAQIKCANISRNEMDG